MNKKELVALITDFHDMDDVVLLSPGGKELVATELDYDAINRTGRVVIRTEWLNPPKPKEVSELERLTAEKAKIEKEIKKITPKKKYNRKPASEYGKKLGRPKKTKTEDETT